MNFEEGKAAIRPFLGAKRFHHSICVSRAAVRLAHRYGADEKKAETAGILHDIMKEIPGDEQLRMMERFGIILTDVERAAPKLWHAMLGAEYIRCELKITDPEIIGAVRYHTTGRKNMSLLEKILFIADFISEDRDYTGVERMREKAEVGLETAMTEGTVFTIKELAELEKPIHPDTIEMYNQMILQKVKV